MPSGGQSRNVRRGTRGASRLPPEAAGQLATDGCRGPIDPAMTAILVFNYVARVCDLGGLIDRISDKGGPHRPGTCL